MTTNEIFEVKYKSYRPLAADNLSLCIRRYDAWFLFLFYTSRPES